MSRLGLLFNRLFKDEIVGVRLPREYWVQGKDSRLIVESYVVTVEYKHRGKKDVFFDVFDEDYPSLSRSPTMDALRCANEFYKAKLKTIQATTSRHENIK